MELNFSVWTASIGSRSTSRDAIEVEEGIDVRATFTLDVYDAGTEDEAVECDDVDVSYHEIDLGEVDVFDHDDYEDDVKWRRGRVRPQGVLSQR